jgi:transcriptional regulator with XRE-family HTH domain
MNERLKELRDLLGLSQGEFAKKIGLQQGSLSDIERGKVRVSNTNVILICKTFNVSEEWFRTGVGDPFMSKYELRTDLSDLEKEILNKYNQLDAEDRKAVEGIIDSLYRKTIND